MRSITATLADRLRAEHAAFPWRGLLLRMVADIISVNLSAMGAFALWFFFNVFFIKRSDPKALAEDFQQYVRLYWVFWSLLAVLVFQLSGFYTRSRGYASKYKAWVIFRAVSLFVICFVFSDYFIVRSDLIPRGVALVTWVLLLITVGGSRSVKQIFTERAQEPNPVIIYPTKQVLVIGGAGYLGSTLVPKLLETGYRVRVLDTLLFGDEPLSSVASDKNFELRVGDIRDIQAVVQAMKGCDSVIHLAAIVGDPACEENRQIAIEINRAATKMIIEIARGYGVQRLLFASSCSVYGASDFLMDEHSAPDPVSTYAQTKLDSERLLLDSAAPDFHPTVLRLGTLFGLSARPRFDLVVNLLTARAATTRKITIFNGQQWRPFLHVSDAARAFIACLEAPAAVVSGQIFNVGDYDMNMQLSEVSAAITEIVPTVEVEHIDNSDRRNYRVSFDKIHTRLGFKCKTTLRDGINEIYEAIASAVISDVNSPMFSNLAVARANAAFGHSTLQILKSLSEETHANAAAS